MEGQGQGQSQSQRVLLAHDASRGVRLNSLRLILDKFLLKDGDMFTLLSVVHQIQHPMGYMMRVDSSMLIGVNQRAINDEIAKKKKEYENNKELIQISKLYETQKVDFKIEIVAGPILKNAVVEASKKTNATWVILDRRMKRDNKYFLEKLSCGISITEQNDNIVKIRGPKRSTTTCQSRDETLLVDNKNVVMEAPNNCEYSFSSEPGSSCTSSTSTTSIEGTLPLGNNQDDKMNRTLTPQEKDVDHVEILPPTPEEKVQLDRMKCTTCNSTRPTDVWQQIRNFSYMELVDATNRFSSENLIYRGENEVVFHGILKDSKLDVVVKVQNDMKKYKSEMQALEKTCNEHVIMLLGTCLEETAPLLVFEYACNGSLDQHLSHQNSRRLTWPERIKIAVGACRGLNHLHMNNIIHGDIRPKNIWLTHDFDPLIAGFGLASLKNESRNSSDHCIIGILGYLAPEYKERGKATTKTDVYAFGTILLHIVTGLSPTDTRLEGQSLIKWANSLVKERKFSELVDLGITYDINQVGNILQLALKCVRKNPRIRLSMEEVMYALDYIKHEKISYKEQLPEENQEVNGDVETPGYIKDDNTNYEGQRAEEIQEVNGDLETLGYIEDEKANNEGQRVDESQQVNGDMETLGYIKDEKTSYEGHRVEESQEVNGDVDTMGQSQCDFDEKLIFSYDEMTPLPKQAKHFYQGK